MHADLTVEEYDGWRLAYDEFIWGERRADVRAFTQTLWIRWRPQHEGEEPDLPSPLWPYVKSQEEKVESEVEAYKRLKQQGIEAQQRMKEKRKQQSGN